MTRSDTSTAGSVRGGSQSPESVESVFPASFAQRRLWFLDQLQKGTSTYNLPLFRRLRGRLDASALVRSLNEVLRRHEVLRTSFALRDGEPVQVVEPPPAIRLSVADVRHLPDASREREASSLAIAEAELPFDLSRSPLMRGKLIRIAEEDHLLVITMHHIASDGWSVGVLEQELSALYTAFLHGDPSPLSELPIQYADYAEWQREWLRGEVLASQLNYWKEQLRNAPPLLALPTDQPRGAVQSFAGASCSVVFSKALVGGLEAASRREGATLFMTLLAGFQVLLSRYSGQDEVLVGSPVAGRTQVETEGLIGFFVNALVLRGDLAGDPTFRELLARTRAAALEAQTHQDLPFEKLVEELNPERNLSHSPIFQAMFDFDNTPPSALELERLSVTATEMESRSAKFDLTLSIAPAGESLSARLTYDIGLFEEPTAQRMLLHYEKILVEIERDPAQRISRIPLLSEDERHRILVLFNQTRSEFPREKCLHELFASQAERTPQSIAADFEGEAITYRQLDARSNQLARRLRRLGVGPDVVVGLHLERSLEMLVSVLGTLKAGGAYLPLDPAYPEERLAYLLDDARPAVVLTRQRRAASLAPATSQIVDLGADWPEIARREDRGGLPNLASSENLAYVIYTSGSTGRPKGVMIPHRGVVNYLAWCVPAYRVPSGRVVPVHSSLSFDLTVTALFVPLLTGGQARLLPEDSALDSLARLFRESERLGLVKITPAHLDLLSQQVSSEVARVGAEALVVGGENLTAESVRFWQDFSPDTAIFNEYGPTETVVGSCVYEVPKRHLTGSVPIGKPIANTRLHVLDRNAEPVPIGVRGELYIGGPGVARGYLNHPELTGEKFVPDAFWTEPGARLYRTGDVARYLPDGTLEFLGRQDDQVKVRGFRVELGEIEATLSEHREIQEAVVVAWNDASGRASLLAYCVRRHGASVSSWELREFLNRKVPDFMIPSAFVWLDALPRTPNGKVDRRALPAPEPVRPDLTRRYVPPQNELEACLATIWEKVLGVSPVGIRDHFFELGGHSLLAARLVSQIEKATGKRLPLSTIFQAPTVGQLAEALRVGDEEGQSSSLVVIQPEGAYPPLFCVHALGASPLNYMDLARHLGPNQPVYALQPQGLDGKSAPHTRLEDMAAHYVREIRAVQPEGPYHLCGLSLGGVIAFEMGRQLDAAGQQVALLALFDTDNYPQAPEHGASPLAQTGLLLARAPRHLRTLLRLSWRDRLRYFFEKTRMLARGLVLTARRFHSETVRNPLPPVLRSVTLANKKAAREYVAGEYRGRVTLFRSSERDLGSDPLLGWGRIALGGIEVHDVPGGHVSILAEPNVGVLAEKLRVSLREARAPAPRAASNAALGQFESVQDSAIP